MEHLDVELSVCRASSGASNLSAAALGLGTSPADSQAGLLQVAVAGSSRQASLVLQPGTPCGEAAERGA